MKGLSAALATTLILALAPSAQGSERRLTPKDLPSAVRSAFQKAYPKARIRGVAQETKEGKTCFEIESREGKISRDLLYLPDGTLVELEVAMPPAQLPSAVKDALQARYPKAAWKRAEQVTVGQEVSYAVTLKTLQGRLTVVLDASGKVLKEEKPEG